VDGVGKTYHARRLLAHLASHGHAGEYVWLRFQHLLSLPLLGVARLLGHTSVWEMDGKRFSQPRFLGSPILGTLYCALFSVDYMVAYLVKIKVPIALGKTVVVDRCVIDALVDLEVATGIAPIEETFFGHLLLRLLKRANIIVYLRANEEELRIRRPEHGQDPFLLERVRTYSRLVNGLGISSVDSTGPPQETFNQILALMVQYGIAKMAQ